MYNMGPIRKVSLSDEIAERILSQVKSGDLKPGEKLPSERELSEIFDTSRATIREAIKGLSSTGILQKKRNGNYICENLSNIIFRPFDILLDADKMDIAEIVEARMTIESQLVRLSAQRATDKELVQMESCLSMDDCEDERTLMKRSIRFHKLIASSTRNKVLEEMYSVIYRILLDNQKNEDSLRKIHNSQLQHREIFEAIKAHASDQAEEAMKKHLSTMVR